MTTPSTHPHPTIPQERLDWFMRHDVQVSDLSASEIVFVRYLQAERENVKELQAKLDTSVELLDEYFDVHMHGLGCKCPLHKLEELLKEESK